MIKAKEPYALRKNNIFFLPSLHYNMETAAQACRAFQHIQPECVAVELPETMHLQMLHASSRLPDISVVSRKNHHEEEIYYMCEPCDAAFEGLRSALESQRSAFCIDLDVHHYPHIHETIPDPYAIHKLGLKPFYENYLKSIKKHQVPRNDLDCQREEYMAKRLKELSLRYDSVLFIGGMFHISEIMKLLDKDNFSTHEAPQIKAVQVCTLSEESSRQVLAESGWTSLQYELKRQEFLIQQNNLIANQLEECPEPNFSPDRQKDLYSLYKKASEKYCKETGSPFHNYHLHNTMKFVRNYAFIRKRLMPDLFQILSAAKACVDHNYAYETWELATAYPYLKNIDNLPVLNLSVKNVWGKSKLIHFHLKQKSRKAFQQRLKRRQEKKNTQFKPPGPFSICSHPPEDVIIENFGGYLHKKSVQILMEESSRTAPFSSSLEDGIDLKETIRNWHQKQLYVKTFGKPPQGTGSVVVIFDEDLPPKKNKQHKENYPWCATWQGEHEQESDMAYYATDMHKNIIGPGICRCEYGGFMMSYPPRRIFEIWRDQDYIECTSKSEVLLMAAIDYAIKPLVTYVAAKPPRSFLKSFARRFGKKIVYIPIGQLSSVLLNKLRVFHVLDGHHRRGITDEYIL